MINNTLKEYFNNETSTKKLNEEDEQKLIERTQELRASLYNENINDIYMLIEFFIINEKILFEEVNERDIKERDDLISLIK